VKTFGGLLLLASVLGLPAGADEPSSPNLTVLAKGYLEARQATMQDKAGPADVDRLLSFCLDSVVYEHPRVGIKLTGTDVLRSSTVNFLGASRNATIRVTASLQGAGVVTAQTDVAFEGKDADKWQPVKRQQIWVFEFEGAKIKRIIEYW
jgi:hypothetical protein